MGESETELLMRLVAATPVPLVLMRLADRAVLEVSESFLTWTGWDRSELLGRSVDVLLAKEPPLSDEQLLLLVRGDLDAYTRRRHVQRADGSVVGAVVHVSVSSEVGPRTTALVTILGEHERPLPIQTDGEPEAPVLGTVDEQWRIDRITAESQELLGRPAASLVSTSFYDLVHPEDVATLMRLTVQAHSDVGATAGRLRLNHDHDGFRVCRMGLAELIGQGPTRFAFCLSPFLDRARPDQSERARTLEAHLHRIAREVLASGVAEWSTAVPTAAELPSLARLTAREYEIVVRLATGERVGVIARGLFLSESTVRNHLTNVYRKVGVQSQEELLSLLASRS